MKQCGSKRKYFTYGRMPNSFIQIILTLFSSYLYISYFQENDWKTQGKKRCATKALEKIKETTTSNKFSYLHDVKEEAVITHNQERGISGKSKKSKKKCINISGFVPVENKSNVQANQTEDYLD